MSPDLIPAACASQLIAPSCLGFSNIVLAGLIEVATPRWLLFSADLIFSCSVPSAVSPVLLVRGQTTLKAACSAHSVEEPW